MLTLEEARKVQKEKENKSILRFIISILIIGLALFLMVKFTNILEHGTFVYIFPVIAIPIAVKSTKVYRLFAPKEFRGTIIKLHLYGLSDHRARVTGRGTVVVANSHDAKALEAEIIAENENGKKIMRTVRNKQIVAELSEGDVITFFRSLEDPVIDK